MCKKGRRSTAAHGSHWLCQTLETAFDRTFLQ